MGDLVLLVWRLLPGWLVNWLDALFRLPLWNVLAGTMALAFCFVLFLASPSGFKDKVKLILFAAALAFLAIELARPLGWSLAGG